MWLSISTCAGLGAGVPVLDGAAGVEDEVVLVVGLLDEGQAGDAVQDGSAVGGGEDAVGVEALAAPLHAAFVFDLLPGEVAVVAHASGGDALPLEEGVVGGGPAGIEFVSSRRGVSARSRKMSKSGRASPGGATRTFDLADAALGVGVGAFFFAPDGGGEDEVGEVAGGRGVEAVLHDEELDAAQGLLEHGVVGEGDGGVGGDEPERFDAAGDGAFDDVGIGEAARGGDAVDVDVPECGEVFAVLRRCRTCDSRAGWR